MTNEHEVISEMEAACHRAFDYAHDKWCAYGATCLTEKERFVLSIETFYGEVTNGGLTQYLGNESQAFANWATEAVERIGIPEFAAVMRKVQAIFPGLKDSGKRR